jgi:hypothetical protein
VDALRDLSFAEQVGPIWQEDGGLDLQRSSTLKMPKAL